MKLNNKFEREDYFIYHGVAYGPGTIVLFSDGLNYSNKRKNIPHIFTSGFKDGYKGFQVKDDSTKNGVRGDIHIYNPDKEIEQIIYPVLFKKTSWQKRALDNMVSGKFHADIFGGVVIYLAVMVVGAIFRDRWLLWIAATIIFINWVLNQYRS